MPPCLELRAMLGLVGPACVSMLTRELSVACWIYCGFPSCSIAVSCAMQLTASSWHMQCTSICLTISRTAQRLPSVHAYFQQHLLRFNDIPGPVALSTGLALVRYAPEVQLA